MFFRFISLFTFFLGFIYTNVKIQTINMKQTIKFKRNGNWFRIFQRYCRVSLTTNVTCALSHRKI